MTEIKFLFIRFSSIGDIVLTTPVIRCLKEQVSGSVVHYLTKPDYSSLLTDNPYIDKVLTLKPALKDTIEEINNEQYDYLIDLHNNLRTMIIKNRTQLLSFSFPKLNIRKWLKVNFKIDCLPQVHIVDRYFETVKLFDVENDYKGLDFFIPKNEEINIQALPEFLHTGFYCFVLGARHFTKKLPSPRAAEIIDKTRLPVILLGDKYDREEAGDVISLCSYKSIYNACGEFSINGSASVIKNSKLVVTNDTGLMHISAAFKKDIISLWGNTIPAFGMYPYLPGKLSEIAEVNGMKCRPCTKIGFNKCPKVHFNCMNLLETGKISDSVTRIWNSNETG